MVLPEGKPPFSYGFPMVSVVFKSNQVSFPAICSHGPQPPEPREQDRDAGPGPGGLTGRHGAAGLHIGRPMVAGYGWLTVRG